MTLITTSGSRSRGRTRCTRCFSRVSRSTGQGPQPLSNRRLKVGGALTPMVRCRRAKVAAQAVALGSQPASEHALADLCAGAVRPALGQPGEELKARVSTVIDGVLRPRLGDRIRCI